MVRRRDTVNEGGVLKVVQRAEPFCSASTPIKKARALAKDWVQKRELVRPARPDFNVTMDHFFVSVFKPYIVARRRRSTAEGYDDAWQAHFALRPHIAGKLMTDVRTSDVYGWLSEIAATDRNKKGELLKKRTMQHLKALISGIFTLAKSFGYYNAEHPVTDAVLPDAPPGAETKAYSLEEILGMLSVLPEPARSMAATAAFVGVRRGELMGLEWSDYGNGELRVLRSIVEGTTEETKTPASKSAVPLLPSLEIVLDAHRKRDGNPATGPIFRTSIGTPLDPNNVLNRQILPVLNRCATCKRPKDEHTDEVAHNYVRDESMPRWHGWHGFRRGLATNLYQLGVKDKTVQAILRHANVATTATYYIKPVSEASVRAMAALDSVLCSTCALESISMADSTTQ